MPQKDPPEHAFHNSIDIIVAAHDAANTMGRAVRSALRQPEVRKIIVVDDASVDATGDAARSADDRSGRLRLIRLSDNVGPAAARNRALDEAEAEFVCVLDADDWIQDGRFARLRAAWSDQWDLLADDLLQASEDHPETPVSQLVGLTDSQRQDIDLKRFVASNIPQPGRARRELGYLKPLMRRSFLDRTGLRYDESLRLGEDYVLYARALLCGARFILAPACGYVAVERTGSLSRSHGAAELAALLAADERLIEEARRLRPDAVTVLDAHRRSVLRDLKYRSALDAKRKGDWAGAMAHMFHSPATAAHVLRQTVRARLLRRRWRPSSGA